MVALVSAAAAGQLLTGATRAELVEIPGAHHHIMLDQPERLGQAVHAFILRGVPLAAPAARV